MVLKRRRKGYDEYMKTFMAILTGVGIFVLLWTALTVVFIMITIFVMYLTRDTSHLEMGWMAILLLMPVASVLPASILTYVCVRKIGTGSDARQ